MKLRLALIALSTQASVLAPHPATAQTLPPHTYAVVTTDGFFAPDLASSTPHVFAPATDFGGAASLSHPAVEWERGSDAFLVATGANLYRVDILDLAGGVYQVQDVTPASAQQLDLFDLDVHPGTGELFLLDQSSDVVLRYSPPFVLGMTPTLTLPVSASARAMAVDSRAWPLGVVTGDATEIARVGVDASDVALLSLPFASGVDQDPQYPLQLGTYGCEIANDEVLRSTGNPGLGLSMNYSGFCTPFALDPRDIEWSPIDQRAYVLAEAGINGSAPFCAAIASGPNHVVEFPLAQTASIGPEVITFAAGSGITGTSGDLAFVQDDFGFVSPFGDGCTVGIPNAMTLDIGQLDVPLASGSTLGFDVASAPASKPTFLIVGFSELDLVLPLGCHVYSSAEIILSMGNSNAQGEASLTATSPALASGTELYLQAATLGGTGIGLALSHGLRLHLGL
jgi:hypothetical protein